MATLYKVKGIWYVNYTIKGKRFKVSTKTSNRKLAELKLRDIELKVFKGELGAEVVKKPTTAIVDFFRRYINYLDASSPVDRHPDFSRLRAMREFFARKGIKYINDISPDLMEEFTTKVLAKRKPKTKRNYIAIMKTALNKAVEWDLIDKNPISKVKPPKIVKTFHFFSNEEVRSLIAEAGEPLKTGIIILVNTGMRRAELYNLRWRDVDLENRRLRVWPYEGFSPKGKRPRSIPFTEEVAAAIATLVKEKQYGEFVFRPYEGPNTLYRHFSRLLKRLKMKGTLHSLRHTFASHLAMKGVPIAVVKELLGHSDITTTMIYSHLSPDIHATEIGKLKF